VLRLRVGRSGGSQPPFPRLGAGRPVGRIGVAAPPSFRSPGKPGTGILAGEVNCVRTIAVVVHAQSHHHVNRQVGGWYDTGLTLDGRDQARRAGKTLAATVRIPSVPIISSDLRRAAETAEIIGEALSSQVSLDPRLRELRYGVAEGKPQAWLAERLEQPPEGQDPLDHRVCEGAESRRDLATRIYAAMSDALTRHPGDLILVTHGFAATFLLACWIGLPIERAGRVHFATRTASISTLVEDDRFANRSLAVLNDTRHLPP
jgi:probable phosphoglycerate mutase